MARKPIPSNLGVANNFKKELQEECSDGERFSVKFTPEGSVDVFTIIATTYFLLIFPVSRTIIAKLTCTPGGKQCIVSKRKYLKAAERFTRDAVVGKIEGH